MTARIITGDALAALSGLPDQSVNCCVTSPPYWGLRDYGVDGQIGLEETPEAYVARLVEVFREVRRVLRDDGTLWLNLGDSYAASTKTTGRNDADTRNAWHYKVGIASAPHRANDGGGQTLVRQSKHKRPRTLNGGGCASWSSREETVKVASRGLKPKDLVGIPWRVAFALQADGWYLRQDIIWHKPNPMPESVRDRCTKAHEYLFLLSKSPRYWFDHEAIKEAATCAGANAERKHAGEMEQAVSPELFRTRPHGRTCGYPDTRNRRDVWTVATKPFSGDLQTSRWCRVAPGDASGDMTHIVSPDCPVHGDLVRLATTLVCDGHADDVLNRIGRSNDRRVQELLTDFAPTALPLVLDYGLDNWGSLLRQCARAATRHNSQSHRTGRAPSTSPACMPSSETSGHTGDTQELRAFFERHRDTAVNNTLPDEMVAHSLDRIPFHSVGRFSFRIPNNCMCSFYKEFTKKIDHFATFPPELIRPCVLAGCPVGGVVLDPFAGAGTTGLVALEEGRDFLGIELNPEYVGLIEKRLADLAGLRRLSHFGEVEA